MRKFLTIVALLLLGLWLGAAIFFGAAVAPSLFNVLRSAGLTNANELAGSIVTRLLAIVNSGGFEISLFLIIVRYYAGANQRLWIRLFEMISLAVMAIMTGIGQWIISARMVALRAAMPGPIDQVASSDPRRIAFDNLHRYSVRLMGIALVAALLAFVVIAVTSIRSPTVKEGSHGH